MSRSKQAIVDEVLDTLMRQGLLLIDRDGNVFARPVYDTESPYPTLAWGVRRTPLTPKTKEQE